MSFFRLLIILSAIGSAAAQDVVMPSDVSTSVMDYFPEIQAAEARRQEALGERLSARGAFDTTVNSEARARLEGFYSGDFLSTEVRRPLGPLGAEVYGGYRISQGDYPIYEDYFFTNKAGEAKVGLLFSLLRDRAIDERRAGVRDARLGVSTAELNLLLTRIETLQDALTAYWRWVAAGRELSAYDELLALAERRDVALRREVESGARAAIFLTENAQNLTRRRELVRRAEQDLALAANNLSLYLRDGDGEPRVPSRAQLPREVAPPSPISSVTTSEFLGARPDLALLDVARERIELQRRLARNALQPQLDVKVEASNDFGEIGPGGVSRDPGEVIAGVTLTVPLGRREARGDLRAAEAALRAVSQERRFRREQIIRELNDLTVSAQTAEDLLALTRQEAEQAEIMKRAERERFRGGASDFFLVNLREDAAANANVRVARAEFALAAARIAYRAATLDLEPLETGGDTGAP